MSNRGASLFGGASELEAARKTIVRLQGRILDLELEALGDMAIRGKLRDARGRFVKRQPFEDAIRHRMQK